ncbi:hypothetical protein DOTSEDRAFT_119524 [Dothistroma septosporum NZE10]|uniref:Enoyl-CoA hydratase n=1 Tax=Dothistroma septosporum (strain NZE10 / CBS 128990) TaxID=675120 RepID=N1Q3R4_DOTSN|nr:hypothetical protein DOTSEDRAFT_119524 [Dothistroma septosporum NZE10]
MASRQVRGRCVGLVRTAVRETLALRALQQHCYLQVTRRTSTSTTTDAPGVYFSTIEKSPGNNVAKISVNNPAKLNIVNSCLLQQFAKGCNELTRDESLRAVVLTGGPTAPGKQASFIGGADITEMNSLTSAHDARVFINRVHSACKALRDIPVPCIARVDGFALGAGLEIMAACDLRVATKRSAFAMPEVKVGIPSVVEANLLPPLIGMGRTRRLLYLAESIGADEAESWGLIEKVVADESALDEVIHQWVGMLATAGPKAIRSQKKLMLKWEDCSIEDGVQAGIEAFADA